MANNTKNSFNEFQNYQKVVLQTGAPVTDSDFNEAQDILRVGHAEVLRSFFSSRVAAANSAGLMPVFALDNAWAFDPEAQAVKAGAVFVDGYRIVMEEDVLLASSLPAVPDTEERFGYVYCNIVLTEITSAEDPSLLSPSVGEPSVRQKMLLTWGVVESADGFEAARALLTDISAAGVPALWKGNVGRAVVARFHRFGVDGGFGPTDTLPNRMACVDMRQGSSVQDRRQTFVRPLRGSLDFDTLLVWDAPRSRLFLGQARGTVEDDFLGWQLLRAGSADQILSSPPATPWSNLGTAANYYTNDDPAFPDAVTGALSSPGGITVPDGYAVGFIGTYPHSGFGQRLTTSDPGASGASTQPLRLVPRPSLEIRSDIDDSNFFISGGATISTADPAPAGKEKAVHYSRLVIAPLSAFSSPDAVDEIGTWILLTRQGRDLLWWNGRATRGLMNMPVIDDPTTTPSPYSFVLDPGGSGHGTRDFALDMALAALSESGTSVSTTWANARLGHGRDIRGLLKGGTWRFPLGFRQYGGPLELDERVADTALAPSSFTLEGTGTSSAKILISVNTIGIDRKGRLACWTICAEKIVLRGLDIGYTTVTTATDRLWMLELQGLQIELEDCTFRGPVVLRGGNTLIRNCTFIDERGVSKTISRQSTFVTGALGQALGGNELPKFTASLLSILESEWNRGRNPLVRAENCTFTDGNPSLDLGAHDEQTLISVEAGSFTAANCSFHSVGPRPCVHVCGSDKLVGPPATPRIQLQDSTFVYTGVAKPGYTAQFPYTGQSYAGAHMHALFTGAKPVATAAISIGYRASASVTGCRIDCVTLGGNSFSNGTTHRYLVMDGVGVVTNKVQANVASLASTYIGRVLVKDCEIFLCPLINTVSVAPAAANLKPCVSGFYMAVPGEGGNDIQFHASDVQVQDTVFDLGRSPEVRPYRLSGPLTGRTFSNTEGWYGLMPNAADPNDASLRLEDGSSPILVQLRSNYADAAIPNQSLRNLVITGNRISLGDGAVSGPTWTAVQTGAIIENNLIRINGCRQLLPQVGAGYNENRAIRNLLLRDNIARLAYLSGPVGGTGASKVHRAAVIFNCVMASIQGNQFSNRGPDAFSAANLPCLYVSGGQEAVQANNLASNGYPLRTDGMQQGGITSTTIVLKLNLMTALQFVNHTGAVVAADSTNTQVVFEEG